MPRPRKFDETDVVAAARDEFWSRGYTATSVDDLTSRHGPGQGQPVRGVRRQARALSARARRLHRHRARRACARQLRDPAYAAPTTAWSATSARKSRPLRPTSQRRGCMMAKSAAELSSHRRRRRADGRARVCDVDCRARRLHQGSAARRSDRQEAESDRRWRPRCWRSCVGHEALHKAGAEAAQIKAAADEMIALIPTRLNGAE